MAQTQSFIANQSCKQPPPLRAHYLVLYAACDRGARMPALPYVIWVSLQLLHPAILAAENFMPDHPCQASTLLHQLLQIVASHCPLPQAMLG